MVLDFFKAQLEQKLVFGPGTSPAAASLFGIVSRRGKKSLMSLGVGTYLWTVTDKAGHCGLPDHGLWVGYCTKVAKLLGYV